MRTTLLKTLFFFNVGLAFSLPALGAETTAYADVKGWTIRVDHTLGNGCFAFAEYERGSILRVGIDKTDNSVYAIFGNEDWESIEYMKNYSVEIQFGNQSKWDGVATGMSFDPPNDQPFLWVTVEDNNAGTLFIAEFMQETSVQLFYDGTSIDSLSLKGSYAAGLKLLECTEVMQENNKDPFSRPTNNKDPFSV